jgi:hypothetical protein
MIRVEFPPRLMDRALAAYYVCNGSIRDLDRLREQKIITPKGSGRNVMYDKADLDAYADTLVERPASRGQNA